MVPRLLHQVKVAPKGAVLVGHVLRNHAVNFFRPTGVFSMNNVLFLFDTVLALSLRAAAVFLLDHWAGHAAALALVLSSFYWFLIHLEKVWLVVLCVHFRRRRRCVLLFSSEIFIGNRQFDVRNVMTHLLKLKVWCVLLLVSVCQIRLQRRLETDPLHHRLLLLSPKRALNIVYRRHLELYVHDLVHLNLGKLQLIPDLRYAWFLFPFFIGVPFEAKSVVWVEVRLYVLFDGRPVEVFIPLQKMKLIIHPLKQDLFNISFWAVESVTLHITVFFARKLAQLCDPLLAWLHLAVKLSFWNMEDINVEIAGLFPVTLNRLSVAILMSRLNLVPMVQVWLIDISLLNITTFTYLVGNSVSL